MYRWYQSINEYMGYVVNCDAPLYVYLAERPAALVREGCLRQSRPLYILAASLVGHTLKFLQNFDRVFVFWDFWPPFYFSYVLLNFAILLMSVMMFDSILTSRGVDKYLVYILSLFLINNDITKNFFWTAHQQMFSIFTPIFTIYFCMNIITSKEYGYTKISLSGLWTGLLMLVYGNFVLTFQTILLAYIYRLWSEKKFRFTVVIKSVTLASLCFILPTVFWMIFVKFKTGTYYNHEMERYRQLVWMLDAFRKGFRTLITAFVSNLNLYIKSFVSFEILPFIIVSLFLFLYYYTKRKRSELDPKTTLPDYKRCKAISMMTALSTFCFFLLLGYYRTRLTFTIIPALLVFIALELNQLTTNKLVKRKTLLVSSASAAAVWFVFHILKPVLFV